MLRKVLFSAIILLLPALATAQVKLLRHPTYSKGRVAFGYLDDIWVANEDGSGAERLTDHKARDIYPRFSPDGNWLAFSSNRAGNYDVWVMPSVGAKPRQLTFHTADDTVVGWSHDGQGQLPVADVRVERRDLFSLSPSTRVRLAISVDRSFLRMESGSPTPGPIAGFVRMYTSAPLPMNPNT